MNREIKFRAWFKGSETMQDWASISHRLSHADSHWYFNNPKIILMQYTGLKDKNGKEIYEGDILTNGLVKGRVEFVASQFDLVFAEGMESMRYVPTISFEIIGNIYENPELLEAQKNEQEAPHEHCECGARTGGGYCMTCEDLRQRELMGE